MKQRLSAHLIRPGDLNPGWVLLYVVTWALQYFCAACRFLLIDAILALLDLITGWGWPVNIPSVVIGFGPLGDLPCDSRPAPWRLVVSAATGRPAPLWARASGLRGRLRAAAGQRSEAAGAAALVPQRGSRTQRLRLRRHPDGDQGHVGEPIIPGRPRPRARAPELKRCPGYRGALPNDDAAAQSDGVSLPPDRLPDQRAGCDGAREDTVGDLLAPPRGGCRCLCGKARTGRSACGLPRYPRPRRRSADPVQGLRRHLPSLDRASHRRPRSRLRQSAQELGTGKSGDGRIERGSDTGGARALLLAAARPWGRRRVGSQLTSRPRPSSGLPFESRPS